jgi:hypothetical protein
MVQDGAINYAGLDHLDDSADDINRLADDYGNTYLDNESWEIISSHHSDPLEGDDISIWRRSLLSVGNNYSLHLLK